MNPNDLLYTNEFINSEIISKTELQNESNNFDSYTKLKNENINDVQKLITNQSTQGNNLDVLKQKAEGWNKGGLSNQRPFLSNFSNDIASESYFDYVKTFVNIDSNMRNKNKYIKPNNYSIYLNKVFQNVCSIKIVDYNFPNLLFPINEKNNKITFFIPLIETLSKFPINNIIKNNINNFNEYNCNCCTTDSDPYELIQNKNGVFSFFFCIDNICKLFNNKSLEECICDCNNLNNNKKKKKDCCQNTNEILSQINDVIKKCIYSITIPPGMYSVESLTVKIENEFNNNEFFNSNFLSKKKLNIKNLPQEYGFPLKLKVLIDPETHVVKYILRFEELIIKKLMCNRGSNILEINIEDNIDVLENNTKLPIIISGLPSIGGINDSNINQKEFLPRTEHEIWKEIGIDNPDIFKNVIYNYYYIENNILKLVLFNEYGDKKIFSRTEIVTDKLNNARVGRESPFNFIFDIDTPILNYKNITSKYINNLSAFTDVDKCQLKKELYNINGSSKSLIVYLGYLEKKESTIVVGNLFSLSGINSNLDYQNYLETDWLTNYGLLFNSIRNIDKSCLKIENNEIVSVFQETFSKKLTPSKYLKIYLGNNGKYYFNNEDYIFLRLISKTNTSIGNYYIQANSNVESNNGIEKIYENPETKFGGVKFKYDQFNKSNVDCNTKTYEKDYLIKDLSNIFAKFKISSIPGKNIDQSYEITIEYFNNIITDLDSLIIQFISYDGEILELNSEHDFVLEITEKLDVLKETNINSRTGYVNKNINN